jgi:cytochrome d ubiquinol oxidase subunit II
MMNFENIIDLPMVWGAILASAVFLYILLDGFDLGAGILFPFAPTDQCQHTIMNSVAPFWNGNETWLVMGGGGLFAAFPLAYAILIPAFYLPLILSLLGLIFRGVAFEFWFKSDNLQQKFWGYVFHFGSLAAGFFQGMILGTFVQGIPVTDQAYSGNGLEWLSTFSLMTGIAVVFGYALLGSTWLIMKTEETTQIWARKVATYVLLYVILFLGIVSISMPLINVHVREFWFNLPNFYYLAPIPLLTLIGCINLFRGLFNHREKSPFFWTIGLFILGYIGIILSIYPYIVPYSIVLKDASASPQSQSLLLVGAAITLPLILAYTGYSYYVFRGKTQDHKTY